MKVDFNSKAVLIVIAVFLTVFALKPCIVLAAAGSLPEYYGVYARDGGRLVRIEEHKDEVTKFAFSPDVTFVIYEKWVSRAGSTGDFVIEKVFYSRNRFFTV